MLKEGGEHLKQVIILLFDAIIETEWIPPTWREERVTLLHKGGSKRSLDNYRTISIGSNFGKLFTRILQTRMQTLAESAGWLGDMQNGFRKGRSTMDSLFILTQVMEQALRKRTKVFLLFLDLRKAFDRVWREGLWRVLQRFGLDGKCSRLIQKLYECHKRKAHTMAGWTEWIQCFIGVKQGCVLSPILFALFVAEIEVAMRHTQLGVSIGQDKLPGLLFADDLVIMAESIEHLQTLASEVVRIFSIRRLEINAKKSAMMMVGGPKRNQQTWKFQHQGYTWEVDDVNSYKYLGVHVSRSKVFQYHEREVNKKATWQTMSLKERAKSMPDVLGTANVLWTRAIKPAILYGAEIITYNKTWLKKLEVSQNNVARWMTGTSAGAPTAGLRAELGWNSMSSEVMTRRLQYYSKLRLLNEDTWLRKTFQSAWTETANNQWAIETREYMDEIGIVDTGQTKQAWSLELKTKIKAWKTATWTREKTLNSKLLQYPDEDHTSKMEYLNFGKMSKIFCKTRLDDLTFNRVDTCKACGSPQVEIRPHVLFHCPAINNTSVVWPRQNGGRNPPEIAEILGDTSCMKPVAQRITAWEKVIEDNKKTPHVQL